VNLCTASRGMNISTAADCTSRSLQRLVYMPPLLRDRTCKSTSQSHRSRCLACSWRTGGPTCVAHLQTQTKMQAERWWQVRGSFLDERTWMQQAARNGSPDTASFNKDPAKLKAKQGGTHSSTAFMKLCTCGCSHQSTRLMKKLL
jgi:hypothetical protein